MSRSRLHLVAAFVVIALVAPEASAQSLPPISAEQQLVHYFYVDFPARLDAINNQIALAEAELTLLARRVDQFRPMRSFRQYGATYLADQAAQVGLLAAHQQVACLHAQKSALWRERQLVAEQLLANSPH